MNKIIKFLLLSFLIGSIFIFETIQAQVNQESTEQEKKKTIYAGFNKRKTYKFDFDNKPLVDIINELADLKNLNIILPQGALSITTRITYHLADPVSLNEAWKILNTLLAMANYTIKPDGDMLMVVKTDTPNITRETFQIFIDEPIEKLPNSEEIIQALFYLANLNVKSMKNDLQAIMVDMLSPMSGNPNIKWDEKTNSVILTDKSILIKNVMKIIKELDQSGLRDTIEVVPLYYTTAQVIDDLFNKQLLAPSPALGGGQQLPQSSYFPRNTKVMALERTNSLVIMGTQHAIDLVKDFIIKYLDRPLETGESILHVYELKYLTAKDLAPVLQQILTPGAQVQAAGKIVGPKQYFKDVIVVAEISSATEALNPTAAKGGAAETAAQPTTSSGTQLGGNRLVVAARKQDWIRIKKLIDDLDKPQPQIAIEVLIVDLTLNSNKFFGTQLRNPIGFNEALTNNVNFQSAQLASPILTQPPSGAFVPGSGEPTTQFPADALRANLLQLINGNTNLATQAIPGSLVIALKDTPFNNVWAVFFLLDSFANATILAQPFLVTQNHQQATVTIAQTRLLPMEADANQISVNQQFEAESAGLTLDILPHISSVNNTINLQVAVNMNEFIDDAQNPNNRITRVVQTSAMVGNKEILALGGLIRERDILNTTKVPILGDIPILGWLFKKEQKQRQKNNLLIFIAPTIIHPRLRGGIDPFTCKKLEYAENEIDEHLAFENLRDPITRWFFKPDPSKAERAIDSFTHHSLHDHADISHEEILSQEPTLVVKNESLQNGQATKLKELVKNEDNPLAGLEQKQL